MKALLLVAVTLVCHPLTGAVVTNDAILKRPPALGFGDYGLELSIPTTSYLIWFDDIGFNQFQVTSNGIAEEMRLFLAPAGTRLDPAYVSSETPFLANAAPTRPKFSMPVGMKLIISFWEDYTFAGPGSIPSDSMDKYGWVELHNNGSGVVISRSATAFGGGIIVGTLTQVPEPSSELLGIGCAATIVAFRVLKRRRERTIG